MNCKNCKFLGEELFVFSDVIPNRKISSGFYKCDAVKPAYSEGITPEFSGGRFLPVRWTAGLAGVPRGLTFTGEENGTEHWH